MKGWPLVFAKGVTKLPLKIVAPFVVPFLSKKSRVHHPVFGVKDATDTSWWNVGIRNSVHNYTRVPTLTWYTVKTNTPNDASLEEVAGWQYRIRHSSDTKYKSFRATWGKPRAKGKREFYIGWTLNNESFMRLTFFQLRLF